jgi:hypothetical protein
MPAAVVKVQLVADSQGSRRPPTTGLKGFWRAAVGRWMVTFADGVIESCEVRNDGSASESETLRSSEGRVSQQAGAILITFADDRVERWTAVDKRMVVEHWFPAAAYPAGDKVVGIADRVQQ